MNVGLCGLRETLKKIFHQFDLEIANAFGSNLCLYDATRPAAKIYSGSGERFVHGHQEITGAHNAALAAEGSLQGFAQRDADIFDRVMLVHVKIAVGVHLQIKRAVPCDQLEHVVEEADSGSDASLSASVQVQLQADVRFVGLAMNSCSAWHDELV